MAQDPFILKQMLIGPMDNFIYLTGDGQSGEVAVVDPAWDVDAVCNEADQNGWRITAVLLTHGHMDHVNGLGELLSRFDVPVYISEHEADFYTPQCPQLKKVSDGEKINVGQIEYECIHAPGHTPGCQCFRHGNTLIVGDVLFVDGCGRCDLPGGDPGQMYDSLYGVIKKLPDDLIVYPGHHYGPVGSIDLGSQKKTNPYLQCSSKEEFLTQRMG